MDVWRYSDWWGLGDQLRNSQKHIWHWRDWIVDSLNQGLPYDEMIRQMLAADESHPDDPDTLRATGFLARNYFLFNRNQWMDETVEHVGKAFLGLTLNCAKCHDHKYDPIVQTDYYRFRAIFEPYHVRLDLISGETDFDRDALPRVFESAEPLPTFRFVRGQENQPDKSAAMNPGIPDALAFRPLEIQPVQLPLTASQPERCSWVLQSYQQAAAKRVAQARERLERFPAPQPGSGMPNEDAETERHVVEAALAEAEAEAQSVAYRSNAMRAAWQGVSDRPQRVVDAIQAERRVALAKAQLGVLEATLQRLRASPDKKDAPEKELKTAMAALDQSRQALTQPIAATNTFTPLLGAKWTPTRFFSSERDDPFIAAATNGTGRRSALARWITDRSNPLTARVAVNHVWTRHFGVPLVATPFDFGLKGALPSHPELLDWLAAELVESGWDLKHLHRLLVTSATYRLSSSNAHSGTNATVDPNNRYWWRRSPVRLESQAIRDALLVLAGNLDARKGGPPVPPAEQDPSRRRSLYFFHSNNDRNLFLTLFDEAGVKECYRREQSIVPQQALALSNSALAQESAQLIAARLGTAEFLPHGRIDDDDAFILRAFAVLLAMQPGADELAACREALAEWRRQAARSTTIPNPSSNVEPARAALIWALLNHNDFVTLR
jgi:hypothetical protein